MAAYKLDQEKKTKHKHFSFTDSEHSMMLEVSRAFTKMHQGKRDNMTKTLVHAMRQLGKRIMK